MMNREYDLAVFVGRFQPVHEGHLHVIRAAMLLSDRLLIVIGSAHAARRPDLLPFTFDERREMIEACLSPGERQRVAFAAVRDVGDPDAWAEEVRSAVRETLAERQLPEDARVTLAGCSKDRSSYYLDLFPQWASIDVPVYRGLSATPIRRAYFDDDAAAVDAYVAGPLCEVVPTAVADWLQTFRATPAYADMVEEQRFADGYRAQWDVAPYPPTFVTADAVVVQEGQVLLIQRLRRPGRGLWALPGGFVEADEFVIDAAVRELAEETGLKVDAATLRCSRVATRVFDAPFRDMRGRVITHASLFHLEPTGKGPPAAEAADDAAELRWMPIDDLKSEEMYSDHFQVIAAMTALLPNKS